MIKLIFKYTNLILLLLSVVWLSRTPDWEPLIAFLTLFFSYLFQDVKSYKGSSEKENIVEHDKALYSQYEELLPENDFTFVLNNDLFNNSMDYSFSKQISRYLYLSEAIKGKFPNKKLQIKFEISTEHLRSIKTFMATHFFVNDNNQVVPPEDWVVSLYPEMKHSGDNQKRELYLKREKELHRLIDKVEEAYITFRKMVKQSLHI